jgi:anti-anti-sigma regulatory factor
MQIEQSSHKGNVVLSLACRIDLAAAPQPQRAVLKQLAEQSPAIVCDLRQVKAIDPLCAGVFSSIRHPALGWPGTPWSCAESSRRWLRSSCATG